MSECRLDHLVVAAADLDTGTEYVGDLLGVTMAPGGRHEIMGTHNRLLRLGEDQYLEVIAIDPEAPPPQRPRWFGLDDPAMHSRLRRGPALITWVARSANIEDSAANPPYRGMEIRDAARGDLRWRMVFVDDGSLLYEGALPLLIEWQGDSTAPRKLPDSGCVLRRFVIQSPQVDRVRQALQDLGLTGVEASHSVQTGLAATLTTPARGEVVLSSVFAADPDGAA